MIISNEAADDLGEMAYYIATLYRPESGHNYVNRILENLHRCNILLIYVNIQNFQMQGEFIL